MDYALQHPGVPILIARQSHTSIEQTTKKTMMDFVLPSALIKRQISSGGKDFVQLQNDSIIHFVGLDDPVRWYSSEIGVFIVDQVEECDEETIIKLITRLRHPASPMGVLPNTAGYRDQAGKSIAGKVILSFNPENPGHWLQSWFIMGASQTRWGFRKEELFAKGANRPLGDAEFFFAKATDNPHLPPGYVEQTLEGLPEHLRRRYLDGFWEYITGKCYFDTEALMEYQREVVRPKWTAVTEGSKQGEVKLRSDSRGAWQVWQKPVPNHRYIAAVDVSSGGAQDYSAIQVIDIESFEQVAEYQAKLDPDLVALEAARIGWLYNDAYIAPEVTGGWGFTIVRELERLRYKRIHTRRVWDRIAKKYTDKLGWDTTSATRAHMLDTLERVLREREFGLKSERALAELGAFVRDERGRPAAQPNMNDDLVIALAIGVTLALERPRDLRKPVYVLQRPSVSGKTGY